MGKKNSKKQKLGAKASDKKSTPAGKGAFGQKECEEEIARRRRVFEPVFLVNAGPQAHHVNMARERGVPVVVMLTNDFESGLVERANWAAANVPELPGMVIVECGDPSLLPIVRERYIDLVREGKLTAEDQRRPLGL